MIVFIEKQIINLLYVYFKPSSQLVFKNSKKDIWRFNFIGCEQYFLDYCKPSITETCTYELNCLYAQEIEVLQTNNSKIILAIDDDEHSIFNVLTHFRLLFSLQTQYINDDESLYNNKVKALFQLCMENTNDDILRTHIVRFLMWNLATLSETRFLSFRNRVFYYNDIALKALLIDTLKDCNKSNKSIIIAKDFLEFAITIIEFLECGFQHDETIIKLESLQKKAIQKFTLKKLQDIEVIPFLKINGDNR